MVATWRNLSLKEKAIVVAAINGARPHRTNDYSFMLSTYYFVAYGGHLHQIYLKKLKADKMPECYILKYDWLDGAWKRMDSFEGRALFLGKPSFGVSAGEQTIMVANRVFYFSSQISTPKFLVYNMIKTEERVSSWEINILRSVSILRLIPWEELEFIGREWKLDVYGTSLVHILIRS